MPAGLVWTSSLARGAHSGHGSSLVSLSMAVAAITRPLTALVFAVPMAVVVLRDAAAFARGARSGLAVAVALPVIGRCFPCRTWQRAVPGGNFPMAGTPAPTCPSITWGFGLDERAPTRTRPPDIERLAQAFATFHRDYTASRVPAALIARDRVFFADLAGDVGAARLRSRGRRRGGRARPRSDSPPAPPRLLFARPSRVRAPAPVESSTTRRRCPLGAAAVAAGAAVLVSRVCPEALRRPAGRACCTRPAVVGRLCALAVARAARGNAAQPRRRT